MAITVDDVRFPEAIERRAQGVRSFSTKIWANETGFERRRALMPLPIRSWIIQSIPAIIDAGDGDVNGVTNADIEQVVAMFEAALGPLYGFKLKPRNDHSVTRAQGLLAYSAADSGWPLRKVYSNGVRAMYRRIFYLDPDVDPVVWINGVETSVTISATGVIIAPPIALDAVVEWAGDFLVPVRFDGDELDDEMSGDDRTMTLPTIKLRELLPE
jgi:uncharacterized protein (TIGR02217 family)